MTCNFFTCNVSYKDTKLKQAVLVRYSTAYNKRNGVICYFDSRTQKEHVIVNSKDELQTLYEANKYDIWVGYNNRHYDVYIFKAILCGFNPKEINDWIIVDGKEGWAFSGQLRNIQLNNFDVMPNPPIGLKTLEGFLGSNIKETEVPFNINRKLTQQELEQTIFYCRHDVEQTIKVFIERKAEFEAQYGIVKAFNLPLNMIGYTEARITAQVLGCVKQDFNDEFDYFFLPCIRLNKYAYVMEWFRKAALDCTREMKAKYADPKTKTDERYKYNSDDEFWWKNYFYKRSFETVVARMQLKAEGKKKEQVPYKKLLNALSGAMKDKTNPAFDPRNNNCMCINGQLMLLDLIEHLEIIQGFELIQSNTDGLIVWIPDTDEAFRQLDDICYEWECRCSTSKCNISLGLDTISEIYQKDVNNYLWIDTEGGIERKGKYVKELSKIDNDLPILNTALVEYMVHGTPIEQTINSCKELMQFQKLVKLSDAYKWVEHEHCQPEYSTTGSKVIKQVISYRKTIRYSYKSYRVFASSDAEDGRILKAGGKRGKPEKFADTPEHCFIFNDDVNGVECPAKLDKNWYIDLAKKRLKQFGILS